MQVVGTSDTTVSCVAVNDATLDGLLTVMICHRRAAAAFLGQLPPPALLLLLERPLILV